MIDLVSLAYTICKKVKHCRVEVTRDNLLIIPRISILGLVSGPTIDIVAKEWCQEKGMVIGKDWYDMPSCEENLIEFIKSEIKLEESFAEYEMKDCAMPIKFDNK